MYFRPRYPQLKNIVFLDHVGETLRCAMSDILQEELPDGIQVLVRRLKCVERQQEMKKQDDGPLA
jgi:hypothetical protein